MFDQDDECGSSLFKVTGRTLAGMDEYRRSHPEFSVCGLNCSLCPRRWMEGSLRCCLPGGMTAAARVSTASPQTTCRSVRCAKSVQGWKRSTSWTHKTVRTGAPNAYRAARIAPVPQCGYSPRKRTKRALRLPCGNNRNRRGSRSRPDGSCAHYGRFSRK